MVAGVRRGFELVVVSAVRGVTVVVRVVEVCLACSFSFLAVVVGAV